MQLSREQKTILHAILKEDNKYFFPLFGMVVDADLHIYLSLLVALANLQDIEIRHEF